MSVLGVDVGTTGCKVAAFSADGRCLAAAYREYAVVSPSPGLAELDSRRVWALIRDALSEVASACASDPVQAISSSSMGEAMTPVDADRQIIGNCILMSDPRGVEYANELRQTLGEEAFYRINRNILGPHYSMPKLRWLQAHQPSLFARASCFLLWGDLVAHLLGADATTTYSLANRTLLFDVQRQDWSDQLLHWAAIPRSKLGRCVASGQEIGTLTPSVAAELGLPARVKIISGGHDQCCNALGAGVIHPGLAVCGLGTYECITPVFGRLPPEGRLRALGLGAEHHVVPGRYVSFLYNQGGSLVRWYRDTFAQCERLEGGDVYAVLSAEMPDEPTSLTVLPYFEPSGPPDFTALAGGAILGLSTSTRRGEILRAIIEGVTMYFVKGVRMLADIGVPVHELVATGGGTRSNQWLQITADILAVPVRRPVVTEATVLGAGILAGVGAGMFANQDEGVEVMVRTSVVFHPDSRRASLYRDKVLQAEQIAGFLKPGAVRRDPLGGGPECRPPLRSA